VNHAVLRLLNPEQVEVEICRLEELDQRRGLTSELDEMWSFVRCKANPRWLWHAIDHRSGKVLAYVFGRRKDEVFLELKGCSNRLASRAITRMAGVLTSVIWSPSNTELGRTRRRKSRASTLTCGRESSG